MQSSAQILMIEDDDQDVELVRKFLAVKEQFPVTIERSKTLSDGINVLKDSVGIDLILLDLCLSDAQGLDSFDQVHQAFPAMPLIILSGNSDQSVAQEALQRGALDFLVKGRFDSSSLCRSIQGALEQRPQCLETGYRDITLNALSKQLKIAQQELERLAEVDQLTRVYNRCRFDEAYLSEWNRLTREGSHLSLVLCEVDNLPAYRDTYGFQVGNYCLQQVAEAIAKVAKRPADCVARYNDQTFMVLLPNTDLAGATYLAEAIRTEVRSVPFPPESLGGTNLPITLSLGVACQIPRAKVAPSLLIEAVHQALHFAREQGKDRVQIHHTGCADPDLHSNQTLHWVSRLLQALDKDQFQLYAQPIYPLHGSNQASCNYEILLRLQDQPGVVCSPSLFLPMVEQYDFMTRIDRWVIRNLLSSLDQMPSLAQLGGKFFIHLSSATCRNGELLDFLYQQFSHQERYAQRFCFEVTENIALSHLASAVELSQILKSLGCQIALDNFGSDMSAFINLKNLPVDYVKIDGLLVRDIAQDQISRGIVESIHNVAKVMGMQTIAEHVESNVILDSISNVGIDFAQGHFYDRARPLGDVVTEQELLRVER